MIIGIGTDIIEIERIKKAVEKTPRFIKGYFTEAEQKLFDQRNNKHQTIAGNFAVKESVSKALGTGFRGFGLKDIEVLRESQGTPYVKLYGGARKIQEELGIHRILVTLSHCKDYAVAYVIAERNDSCESC